MIKILNASNLSPRSNETSNDDVFVGISGLWQRLSVRLMLVFGVFIFFATVAVDSLQQASAADMPASLAPAVANGAEEFVLYPLGTSELANRDGLPGSYLDFDAKTASRLQHSDLLGARLTRSRLTSAHLFTGGLR